MHDEQRYAIKFCWRLGNSAVETYALIKQAYSGEEKLSRATVFRWHASF